MAIWVKIRYSGYSEGTLLRFDRSIQLEELLRKIVHKLEIRPVNTRKPLRRLYKLILTDDAGIVIRDPSDLDDGFDLTLTRRTPEIKKEEETHDVIAISSGSEEEAVEETVHEEGPNSSPARAEREAVEENPRKDRPDPIQPKQEEEEEGNGEGASKRFNAEDTEARSHPGARYVEMCSSSRNHTGLNAEEEDSGSKGMNSQVPRPSQERAGEEIEVEGSKLQETSQSEVETAESMSRVADSSSPVHPAPAERCEKKFRQRREQNHDDAVHQSKKSSMSGSKRRKSGKVNQEDEAEKCGQDVSEKFARVTVLEITGLGSPITSSSNIGNPRPQYFRRPKSTVPLSQELGPLEQALVRRNDERARRKNFSANILQNLKKRNEGRKKLR